MFDPAGGFGMIQCEPTIFPNAALGDQLVDVTRPVKEEVAGSGPQCFVGEINAPVAFNTPIELHEPFLGPAGLAGMVNAVMTGGAHPERKIRSRRGMRTKSEISK